MKELFHKTSETLIDMGAFFDRPYGPWGKMIYSRTYAYTQYLRDVKQQVDPNNIMNPGKLCF
jgi:FAD/FMN-containing dehydrogenase